MLKDTPLVNIHFGFFSLFMYLACGKATAYTQISQLKPTVQF